MRIGKSWSHSVCRRDEPTRKHGDNRQLVG